MNRLSALLSACASGNAPSHIPAPPGGGTLPGIGPSDARIAVIRDLYASFDDRAEKKLRGWMRSAGVQPDRCYFDEAHVECRDRLQQLDRLQVIVCVGNQALRLFTGLEDITKRRGSVYTWEGKKVIGIIPPGMVMRHKQFEVPCRIDWERVKLLTTPHMTHHQYCGCALPLKRTHYTLFNTERDHFRGKVAEYTLRAQEDDALLSVDIETPKVDGKREIICVGFAFSAEESMTLPWNNVSKGIIKLILESPCAKLGHNFVSFDRWWLHREGINVGGRIFDSMCEAHALNPASWHDINTKNSAGSHSLDALLSVHTWEPYYKQDGKGHDITVIEKDYDGYFSYCGKDACCARELHDIFWPQLVLRNLVPFYEQHYEALYDPILELMSTGVRIDHRYRETLLHELLQEARTARDRLGELNNAPLFTLTTKRDKEVYTTLLRGNTETLPYPHDLVAKSLETISKKTVSGTQLKVLLYDKMGLPPQLKRRSTGDETLTADSVTLRKLKLDHPEREDVAEVVDLAQQHNKAQKLASFLYPGTFDMQDGRFRFTLRLNTEASRFASSQAPNGLGRNAQNAPRDKRIRRIMLPDAGHILLEADLSQVEGRLCFLYTGDPELLRLARLRANEFDSHKMVVSILPKKTGTYFGFPMHDVPSKSDERQVAKSINHAAMRNIQAATAVDTLLKQDERFLYSEEDVEAMLEAYHKAFPAIRVWQASIRKEIRAHKALTSSWGHTWDVRYEELNDDLFRRAYSWKMQRDCAGLINQYGFIPLWNWLKKEKMRSRILFQVHDSLVVSCALDEAYDVAVFMKEHLEAPKVYDGVELSVPVEFAIGPNYGDKKELLELPDRATFERIALTCVS